jgi:hypothetical protein
MISDHVCNVKLTRTITRAFPARNDSDCKECGHHSTGPEDTA